MGTMPTVSSTMARDWSLQHTRFSGTTQVSQYQKGKTNLDFTEPRDSEWQWQQLGSMQVCILFQTDNHANHASTPPLKFFTDRIPFVPPNQQRQSTEGKRLDLTAVQNNDQQCTCTLVTARHHQTSHLQHPGTSLPFHPSQI